MNTGDVVIEVPTLHLNLSEYGFAHWARLYLKCATEYVAPDGYSHVPYFLLCRAIELGPKSLHLLQSNQSTVKFTFGHKISKAYAELPAVHQTLSPEQVRLLDVASRIYAGKGFEYFPVGSAVRGFVDVPPLDALRTIAEALVPNDV